MEKKITQVFKQKGWTPTKLHVNKTKEGETLEQKIERMLANKEPIDGQAALIYTERVDGVLPQYNVRTDRMEIAVDAMDIHSKTLQAKRQERQAAMKVNKNNDGGPESTQGKAADGTQQS